MKRKSLWVFALVLWLLVFSTIFSLWVEQIMVPWVTVTRPVKASSGETGRISLDCLQENEAGSPVIYQTYEGTGWEEGTRISIMPQDSYRILEEFIQVDSSYLPIVRYFTKTPEAGQPVNMISKTQSISDTLLVLSPEPLAPLKEEIPENYQILDQTDTALLVSSEKTDLPFLPNKAESELFSIDPNQLSRKKVYSFAEVEEFAGKLLLLVLCMSFVLVTLILWGFSCTLLKDLKKHRRALLLNGSLAVGFLLATPFLLNAAQLPSSLLPQKVIVEFGHYIQEFSQLLPALKAFSNQPEARALLSHVSAMPWVSLGILVLGILFAVGIVLLEKRHGKSAERSRTSTDKAEKECAS